MNISNINKAELNDDEIFSLFGIDLVPAEKKNLPANKHKKKGNELRDKKRELGLAREELSRIKSERCPYSDPKGLMGGPSFQWGLDHQERIEQCENKIANIKNEMAELTQKQR